METIVFFGILIFSVILHEIAHGWVAEKLGDPTARLLGRITLNPIPHIDPLGTILLPALFILPALISGSSPGFFIAWAKPVPVNPLYLKDGKKDMAIVALSGPLTNIIIAVVFAALFHTILPSTIIISVIFMNLYLAFLNLIPIPPLDGSKVISILLSDEAAARFQSIGSVGILILVFLLFFPIGGFSIGRLLFSVVQYSMSLLKIPLVF